MIYIPNIWPKFCPKWLPLPIRREYAAKFEIKIARNKKDKLYYGVMWIKWYSLGGKLNQIIVEGGKIKIFQKEKNMNMLRSHYCTRKIQRCSQTNGNTQWLATHSSCHPWDEISTFWQNGIELQDITFTGCKVYACDRGWFAGPHSFGFTSLFSTSSNNVLPSGGTGSQGCRLLKLIKTTCKIYTYTTPIYVCKIASPYKQK